MGTIRKTLVIGASINPERYSNKAILRLKAHGHPVIAYAKRDGKVEGVAFETMWNPNWEVDTVTMYVGPAHQEELMDKIIALGPKRVIFNPGTENPEFFKRLKVAKIPFEEACTLVLLSTNQY